MVHRDPGRVGRTAKIIFALIIGVVIVIGVLLVHERLSPKAPGTTGWEGALLGDGTLPSKRKP